MRLSSLFVFSQWEHFFDDTDSQGGVLLSQDHPPEPLEVAEELNTHSLVEGDLHLAALVACHSFGILLLCDPSVLGVEDLEDLLDLALVFAAAEVCHHRGTTQDGHLQLECEDLRYHSASHWDGEVQRGHHVSTLNILEESLIDDPDLALYVISNSRRLHFLSPEDDLLDDHLGVYREDHEFVVLFQHSPFYLP